jgi:hypothetical protein
VAYYPANVIATSLSTGIDSTAIDIAVSNGLTYPDPTAGGRAPYKVIVGYNTSREEICLVVGKPTVNTLRVTRGHDSTPATAKNAGDVVVPGVGPADFTDFAAKVPLAGGTMTGPLTLSGNPTDPGHAANQGYVDQSLIPYATRNYVDNGLVPYATRAYVDPTFVPMAGNVTMTGPLSLNGPPATDLQAATKRYVDNAPYLKLTGGALTGPITSAVTVQGAVTLPTASPTGTAHATHKKYVDDSIKTAVDTAMDVVPVATGVSYASGWRAGSVPVTMKMTGKLVVVVGTFERSSSLTIVDNTTYTIGTITNSAYRPANGLRCSVPFVATPTAGGRNYSAGQLNIDGAGVVLFVPSFGGTMAVDDWVSLGGLAWFAN